MTFDQWRDTTPAPIGADALREALWICVEHVG